MTQDIVTTTESTAKIGAHVERVTSRRLAQKQGVESGHAKDMRKREVQGSRDQFQRLVGQIAELVLGHVQHAQQGGLPGGIAREQSLNLLMRLFGKLKWHRIAWLACFRANLRRRTLSVKASLLVW